MSHDEDRPSSVRVAGGLSPASALVIGRSVDDYRLSEVSLRHSDNEGEPVFEMRMPASAERDPVKEQLSDRNFMAWLPIDFHDGAIDVELLSELEPDAPGYARGLSASLSGSILRGGSISSTCVPRTALRTTRCAETTPCSIRPIRTTASIAFGGKRRNAMKPTPTCDRRLDSHAARRHGRAGPLIFRREGEGGFSGQRHETRC